MFDIGKNILTEEQPCQQGNKHADRRIIMPPEEQPCWHGHTCTNLITEEQTCWHGYKYANQI